MVAGGAAGSQKTEAAQKFIAWATSKDYLKLVAEKEGWANVPPGTRTSLYENADYPRRRPSRRDAGLDQLRRSDQADGKRCPSRRAVLAIPEFQGLGTQVGSCSRPPVGDTTSTRLCKVPRRLPLAR